MNYVTFCDKIRNFLNHVLKTYFINKMKTTQRNVYIYDI